MGSAPPASNAATGQPLTPPLRHAASVVGGAFSRDGRRVLTVCGDHSVRVWEIPGREPPPVLTQLPQDGKHAEDGFNLVDNTTGTSTLNSFQGPVAPVNFLVGSVATA